MGYTTKFVGSIKIDPPLNEQEVQFLNKFSDTRRMNRKKGPYFVEGTGYMGQGGDADIIDCNSPPDGQPGLWCKWIAKEDGTEIMWNGAEKFYYSEEWMQYLIDHFLSENAIAKDQLEFLQCNHILNGVIKCQGEENYDQWKLVVIDNKVSKMINKKMKTDWLMN